MTAQQDGRTRAHLQEAFDVLQVFLILRRIAIPHERLQTETVGRRDDDGNTRSHASDSHAIGSSGIPRGIQMSDLIH